MTYIARITILRLFWYAAYLQYVLRWYVNAWSMTPGQEEWEELRGVATRAIELYGGAEIVKEAIAEVERQYLMRAVRARHSAAEVT